MGSRFNSIRRLSSSLWEAVVSRLPGSSVSPDVTTEVDRMKASLKRIKATLVDLDRREVVDDSVKLWISEQKEIAYYLEDILKEYDYEVLKFAIESEHFHTYDESSKQIVENAVPNKCSFVQDGYAITSEHDFVGNEKNESKQKLGFKRKFSLDHFPELCDLVNRWIIIRQKLDDLGRDRDFLQLKEEDGERRINTHRPPTTGLVRDSPLFGRENDTEYLIKLCLSNDSSNVTNISVISVVGMAGVGKTSLAQLIFNDNRVSSYFDLNIWVSVSENFNVARLTRDMIECVTGQGCQLNAPHSLQIKLKSEVEGKRFLLILDDVWNENRSLWEDFTRPLQFVCTEGSKILVTTRNQRVSEVIEADPTYQLSCLTDDQTWSLFSQKAFYNQGHVRNQKLVEIGRNIVSKCKGLPLTAKALGDSLRGQTSEDEWEDILNSKMWELSELEHSILPILEVSYKNLPLPVKQCFAYCALFPKDYIFERERLIQMWMAQGFIEINGSDHPEDIGNGYIDLLISRSFFQHCTWQSNKEIFVMHDLIHDFAEFVSRESCLRKDFNRDAALHKKNDMMQCQVQHFAGFCHQVTDEILFEPFLTEKYLRTVLLNNIKRCDAHHSFLSSTISRLNYLRVLYLCYESLVSLHESIGQLKCLCYLGIEVRDCNTPLSLPDSIGSLYNLETLNLSQTGVVELPKSIIKLVNLKYLLLPRGAWIPQGIGKLPFLRSMPIFTIKERYGYGTLEELQQLNLRGDVQIVYLENVFRPGSVRTSCLKHAPHIRSLKLEWWNTLNTEDILQEHRRNVLEVMEPHTNVEKLTITGYVARDFPLWVGHSSYSKLVLLNLTECNTSKLPALGQLPLLKHLYLEVQCVDWIDRQFFIGGFQSLEVFEMSLSNLLGWDGAQEGEFPQLRELKVECCKSLRRFSIENLTKLERICIRNCNRLESFDYPTSHCVGMHNFLSLKTLEISWCQKFRFPQNHPLPQFLEFLNVHSSPILMEWCRRNKSQVTKIPIHKDSFGFLSELIIKNVLTVQDAKNYYIEDVETLQLKWDQPCDAGENPYDILNSFEPSRKLGKLVINGYNGNVFVSWIGNSSFSNLFSVELLSCPNCKFLPPLGQLPSLHNLYIDGLHQIETIGEEFYGDSLKNAFRSLRTLELKNMNELEEWRGPFSIPRLIELKISNCNKLRALPRLSPNLKKMEVEACQNLEIDLAMSDLQAIQTLHVSHIHCLKANLLVSHISIENCKELAFETIPTLRTLVIKECCERAFLEILPQITNLTSLKVSFFPKLTTLPVENFRILQDIEVVNCPELVSIQNSKFCSPKVTTTDCRKLLSHVDEGHTSASHQ